VAGQRGDMAFDEELLHSPSHRARAALPR
jgi:hypothetical protein